MLFNRNASSSFLVGVLLLTVGSTGQARAQSILIDFGNASSYRGLSVSNPDFNGNYWNSVYSGAYYPDLVDSSNHPAGIALGFSAATGTDSYNGPAGPVSDSTYATDVLKTDVDTVALGKLSATYAVFDYYVSARFELQGLDPAKTYDLTFFGSHKYNVDNVTRYAVYTDNTYSAPVAFADLTVGAGSMHNRDTVVTLTNLSPQTGNILYVKFAGVGGNLGYLNAMEITVHSEGNRPPLTTSGSYAVVQGGELVITANSLATDPNGDNVLFTSVGVVDPVDFGSVTITDGGASITYTNTGGAPGSVDQFSYVVSDGNGGSATNNISVRTDPATGLGLISVTGDGTNAYLTYAAIPGTHYALDRASSLTPPVQWEQQQIKTPDSNGVLRFTNALALPPTNSFFRARSVVVVPDRGAPVPYRTYQAEDGVFGGAAALKGPSMDEADTASEASGREYIELAQTGAFVEWTVQEPARGMVLRLTLPDAPTGGGTSATLGLYVNGSRISSLALTSRFAWQYFPYVSASMDPSNDPATGRPRMRFDDVRYIFTLMLNPGDVIRFQKDAQDTSTYGIDLIELEPIPEPIAAPLNALDVAQSPYNAVPDDAGDDYAAFNSCVHAARTAGKPMYIPPGRYNLSQSLKLNSVRIQGAGMWLSELHFTNPNNSGLLGQGSDIVVHDLYLTTENTARAGSHGIGGYFGQHSVLSNLWVEHFVTGGWIADYSGANQVTDGLLVSGCRLRNTYADGLNFAKGTKNSIVENTHFRNNGDDAMATWPSDATLVPETSNNTFRFNTVENTWRAAGLGIFGGRGHVAHDCVFRDLAGQAGIRFNTVFPGHSFSTSGEMVISNMTLLRTSSTDLWGKQMGAVTFQTVDTPVRGIHLTSLDIEDPQCHGIYYSTANGQPITNVVFNTVLITDSGQYGIYVKNGGGGWSENSFVTVTNSGSGPVWNYSPAFDLRKIEGNQGW